MREDPTLFSEWTPPSSCHIESTAIGPIIGGGLSLLGGHESSNAASDAAQAQVQAAQIAAGVNREALGFQKDVYNTNRADLAPYRATGGAALGTLSNMFIPGGQDVVSLYAKLNELRAQRAQLAGGSGGTDTGTPQTPQSGQPSTTDLAAYGPMTVGQGGRIISSSTLPTGVRARLSGMPNGRVVVNQDGTYRYLQGRNGA